MSIDFGCAGYVFIRGNLGISVVVVVVGVVLVGGYPFLLIAVILEEVCSCRW